MIESAFREGDVVMIDLSYGVKHRLYDDSSGTENRVHGFIGTVHPSFFSGYYWVDMDDDDDHSCRCHKSHLRHLD